MNQWWGYIHKNGNIQVKRYFSPIDTSEARESPFVLRTYGPFDAANRNHAISIIQKKERQL